MKFVIYKYPLTSEITTLQMLPGAKMLDVQFQGSTLVLWAKGEPSDVFRETRRFVTRPTGHAYEVAGENYIATVQDARSGLVWHVFEVL